MALRPVSELGLVEVTDLAALTPGAAVKRRRGDGGAPGSSPRAPRSRAVAQTLGVSLTCVVAGAAGVLLGRAAVRS